MAHHRPHALVTGATSGIGRAIAETLATSHSVVATGRAVDGLAQLDALDHVRALALDVTDRPAVLPGV